MGKAAAIQHDYGSQVMYLHLHASPHSGTQPSSNIYGKNHIHQQTKLDITAWHFLLQKQLLMQWNWTAWQHYLVTLNSFTLW